MEVLKKYVEYGLGISIVTDICLSGQEKLERIPVVEFFPKRTYGIFLRKGKILSPAAREFIQCVDDQALSRLSNPP